MNSDKKMTTWDWHAAFADQGLLYYWTKYIKRDVSVIIGSAVQHWSDDGGEGVSLRTIDSDNPLEKYSCFPKGNLAPPYRDFCHFTGRYKPWDHDLSGNVIEGEYESHNGVYKMSAKHAEMINLWKSIFLEVQEHTPSFNFSLSWIKLQMEPPIGRYSTFNDMIRHIRAKKKMNWTHYQE